MSGEAPSASVTFKGSERGAVSPSSGISDAFLLFAELDDAHAGPAHVGTPAAGRIQNCNANQMATKPATMNNSVIDCFPSIDCFIMMS